MSLYDIQVQKAVTLYQKKMLLYKRWHSMNEKGVTLWHEKDVILKKVLLKGDIFYSMRPFLCHGVTSFSCHRVPPFIE